MNSESKTTAEQLTEIRRAVAWTLWKIATTDPGCDIPFRGYSVGEEATIQGHAEQLFKDQSWVANVVGEFAAIHLSEDRAEFEEKFDG